jgi:hypothetical protein
VFPHEKQYLSHLLQTFCVGLSCIGIGFNYNVGAPFFLAEADTNGQIQRDILQQLQVLQDIPFVSALNNKDSNPKVVGIRRTNRKSFAGAELRFFVSPAPIRVTKRPVALWDVNT